MKQKNKAEKNAVDQYILDCTLEKVLRLLILYRSQSQYKSFEELCEDILKECYTEYEQIYQRIEREVRKKSKKEK